MKPLPPMTIQFKEKGKVVTIKADRCSGEIPAGSNTYYCCFYWQGAQVARVPRTRLVLDDKAYSKLFGRPWIEKLRQVNEIYLSEYDNWETEIGGYPEDTDTIYMVNHDSHMWVIIAGTGRKNARAILHVMNNEEFTRKGEYQTALKKLFPGKKISMQKMVYTTVEIT